MATYTKKITHKVEAKVDRRNGFVKEVVIQEETSPIMENYVDVKLPVKHYFNVDGGFISVFKEAFFHLVAEGDLKPSELKLLCLLMSSCGKQNAVVTDLDRLAEVMKMDKTNVSRYLGKLKQRGLIVCTKGQKRWKEGQIMLLEVNFDQLNYHLAYNGRIQDYKKFVNDHPLLAKADGTPLLPQKKEPTLFPEFEGDTNNVQTEIEVVNAETGEIIQ